ncbi:hypothetical protein CHS0354_001277 [Potamilus streckersoni]|uniref:Uncharacterized protein n=1 Tax=Potamilus streckersoni TaxID=2493646 RepID=A0AAE0VQX1_9BIVA|nr:hypothetical protein CHS0354_001277 [Potamilus streckersoni]
MVILVERQEVASVFHFFSGRGYTCTVMDISSLHGIAFEPNTHLTLGTCLPSNGISGGASIAVEGGR